MVEIDLSYPQAVLIGLVIVVNLALVGASLTSSVALGPYNNAWNGGSELRGDVTGTGANPHPVLSTTAYEETTPQESVAFILRPTAEYDGASVARIRAFVQQGGRVVVAGDGNGSDPGSESANALLADLGLSPRIDGGPLRDEQYHWKAPVLPIARNVTSTPLTANVSALTLNRGATVEPDDARVLVRTSGVAYIDTNENGTLDPTERVDSYPVVAATALGEGTVVVVSDASIFANTMLDQTDNRQFVTSLIGDRQHVVLDYSHTAPLPPLAYALVTIRTTPLLQVVLGLAGVGLIVLWIRWPSVRQRLPGIGAGDETGRPGEPDFRLTEADINSYLEAEHPEWDESRRDRVTKAVIRQRDDTLSND